MSISSARRGAYYKGRTKRWLETQGYQVADLEKVHWIMRAGRPTFATKRDQFGSDLLAVNRDRVIFVQVKGGGTVTGGTFPAARRRFAACPCPPCARQWIIAWPIRSKVPRVVELGHV